MPVTHQTSKTIVACLGSSSTAGKGQAFDWIGTLAKRPANAHVEFRNFGRGGDLAYNALQRLPQVLDCKPSKIVVWIGGNDVLAMVFPKVRRLFYYEDLNPKFPLPICNIAQPTHRISRQPKFVMNASHGDIDRPEEQILLRLPEGVYEATVRHHDGAVLKVLAVLQEP